MSEDRIRLIRTGHTEVGDGTCGLDGDEWPCDTAVVLHAYMNDLRDLLPKAEQLAAAEGRAVEWKAGYHEQVRKLARSVADCEIAKIERDAQVARQAEQLAAAAELRAAIAGSFQKQEAENMIEFGSWPQNKVKAQRFLDALAMWDALAAAEQPAAPSASTDPLDFICSRCPHEARAHRIIVRGMSPCQVNDCDCVGLTLVLNVAPAVCLNCNRERDGGEESCACSDDERAYWDSMGASQQQPGDAAP